MKISTKLLRNSLFVASFSFLLFIGCNKKTETKKFAARVNDAYLTEKSLSEFDTLFEHGFSRTELVKKWVEEELLYQEAIKLGLTENNEFNQIINDNRRKLASSMVVSAVSEKKLTKPGDSELREYYDVHKGEFKFENTRFVINLATFATENSAIKFRNKLIESSWEKVIESFTDNKSLIEFQTKKSLSRSEIYPIQLLKLLEMLQPGEVSIVLKENPTKFYVVQLLQVYGKGNQPDFEVVRNEVEERYLANRRVQIYKEFLDELYLSNEIEIKEK